MPGTTEKQTLANVGERLKQIAGPLTSLMRDTISGVKDPKVIRRLVEAILAANSPALGEMDEISAAAVKTAGFRRDEVIGMINNLCGKKAASQEIRKAEL